MSSNYWRSLLVVALLLGCGGARAGTLFDDLGGKPGIERIVSRVMVVWQADPRVGPTFEDTNVPRFQRLLADQLCAITGGGCAYGGRSMADAHRGLHLATVQFNALAEDLQAVMDELNIGFSTQNRLIALLAPMHRDVVTR